ncbi:alpha/beta fold hydrolase [Pseudonocardia sp. GCM10023141]|uniref:alpha/beta fold hydrolase n=1 Tax=Pseudonocardia sp. GCM10023141 TaxID=3252653 RepID=UPI0036188FD3
MRTALTAIPIHTVQTGDGIEIGYRELGSGPPVLLLHGWPTSSLLWREVMPPIAADHHVIAMDLPGFGASGKPIDARYDFAYFERAVDGLLGVLGIDRVAIAGHDIGGPIAAHWALGRPARIAALALLNTLLHPEFSPAVVEFVRSLLGRATRDHVTGPAGLAEIMRLGLADGNELAADVLAAVQAPFATAADRLALARAGVGLGMPGFAEIAAGLPSITVPVRAIYGEQDRVLPDVADTMARLQRDVPHAEVTPLPGCGHFLQEEEPALVGGLLRQFFAEVSY